MSKGLWLSLVLLVIVFVIGCPPVQQPDDGGGNGGGGDATAGRSVYDTRCSACHVLGSYDTAGFAPNLVGRQTQITSAFVSAHIGATLTDTEILNLQAFVAAQ